MAELESGLDNLRPRRRSRASCGSTGQARSSSPRRTASRTAATRSPTTVDTRFATASGTKGLTALAVVSLIEDGLLELSTTARSVLGGDLPLIDDGVTIEHLLVAPLGDRRLPRRGRRARPHRLPHAGPRARARDDRATTSPCSTAIRRSSPPASSSPTATAATSCSRLIAERVSGAPFHELVRQRVCEPAGMHDTEFLRSDELPGRCALGYLEIDGVWRTQRLPPAGARQRRRRHLHHRRRRQLVLEGALRRADRVRGLGAARWCGRAATSSDGPRRYGLGFWLSPARPTP